MLSSKQFRLTPDRDIDIDAWLFQYDSTPRLFPLWPESNRMTLVAVILNDVDTPAEALESLVITSPQQAQDLFTEISSQRPVLFFNVPKRRVMQICPEIREEDWYTTPLD